MLLIGLYTVSRKDYKGLAREQGRHYKRKTAVGADVDLGLVKVDENARVAEGTATTIARHHLVMTPADGLLVDELDGGVGAGLFIVSADFRMATRMTYLIFHDRPLKPRSTHGHLPWILAPAPNAFVVGRLFRPQALSRHDILLQPLVQRAFRRCGGGVGLGHVGRHVALHGVVGGHLV